MGLMCGCDGDYPDIFNTTTPKAMKPYKCEECGGDILPGETYWRYDWLIEGQWWNEKLCEPCGDLSESLSDLGFCWERGTLKAAHQEYVNNLNWEQKSAR